MRDLGIVELFSKWLCGNPEAISFITTVHQIVELWDDLIDQDKPVKPKAINAAFYAALIELPRNGFYRANFALLNPVFEAAILDWFTANALEQRWQENDLHSAYMLRCGIHMLTVMSARLIGGMEWANKVNLELRSLGDTFDEYSKEFGEK